MKAQAGQLLKRLPGRVSAQRSEGERFVQALANGTMAVELYVPIQTDPQSPHLQDELYFVISGTGDFVCGHKRSRFGANTVLFVPPVRCIASKTSRLTSRLGSSFGGRRGASPQAGPSVSIRLTLNDLVRIE